MTYSEAITAIERHIRARVHAAGYKRAGYWISENAARAIGLADFGLHGSRRDAARALYAGHGVLVDLGYNGRITDTHSSIYIQAHEADAIRFA